MRFATTTKGAPLNETEAVQKHQPVEADTEMYEECLFGEDSAMLKSVSDLERESSDEIHDIGASTESLTDEVNGMNDAPQNCNQQPEDRKCPPPCVSRTIDANGRATLRIILTDDFYKYTGVLVGLIDSSTENDLVEITIDAETSKTDNTFAVRSFLSAIDRCKAKVVTRAGTLCSMSRIALWLSGDECWMSPCGWICLKQTSGFAAGDVADVEAKCQEVKASWEEFKSFIAKRGLFTIEELENLYVSRGILSLCGETLRKRVAAINAA